MSSDLANSIETATNDRAAAQVISLQRAATDFILVGSLTGLVKLVGALKSAISVRVFGISHALDCYLVAFALSSLICEVLAGSLTSALIPTIARARDLHGPRQIQSGYGAILYCAIAVLTTAGLITIVLNKLVFRIFASGFSEADLALTRQLFVMMLPLFPLTAITAVWRAMLNSSHRFALAALSPIATPLTATLFLCAASVFGGIYALALGSAVGALGEVVLLAFGVSRLGFAILPRCRRLFDFRDWLASDYLPILTSSLVGGSRPSVDQAVAATLSPGSVSTLHLGTRLVAMLTSLGPSAASTISLPKLSVLSAKKQWATFRRAVQRSLVIGLLAASALSAVLILCSHMLAYIAFEKGATHPLNISVLSQVQSVSFLQLPFSFASAILIRVIVAARLNRQLLLVSVLGFATNLALDLVLARFLRVSGIVLATAILQALTCLVLLLIMRRLPERDEIQAVE